MSFRWLVPFLLGFTLMWGYLGTRAALAHEWYPKPCCSDKDCHPVDCAEVHHDAAGWHWRGSHFADSVMKPAPDGACHVCVTSAGFGICIFLGGVS